MPILTRSARLTLRSFERADIPDAIGIWCDPETMQFMGGPRDKSKLLAYMEELLSNENEGNLNAPDQFWSAVLPDTNEYIGDFGLIRKEVDGQIETELVYLISKQHWGQGYATEGAMALAKYGFEIAKLPRIVSLIDLEHTASQRVAEKIGMACERETVRPNGRRMKVYVLAR